MRRLLLALAVGAVVFFLAKTALSTGHWSRLEPTNQLGTCTELPGIHGPEDLARLDDSAALVSSTYLPPRFEDPRLRGELYLLSGLQVPTATPVVSRLDTSAVKDFRPHGIATLALTGAPGRYAVAAINHARAGDRIELFTLDLPSHTLTHLRSLSDAELLVNANDLVFLGEDELLVTHDHASRTHGGRRLEDYLKLGRAYVTYWRNGHATRVLSGLDFANGITELAPGHWALAAMLDKTVHQVSWKTAGEALQIDRSVRVPGFPDNLLLDARGERLYVALHHDILALKSYSEGHRVTSPSQIVSLSKDLGDMRSELASGEPQFAAVSSALVLGQRTLLGNIYSSHLDNCLKP